MQAQRDCRLTRPDQNHSGEYTDNCTRAGSHHADQHSVDRKLAHRSCSLSGHSGRRRKSGTGSPASGSASRRAACLQAQVVPQLEHGMLDARCGTGWCGRVGSHAPCAALAGFVASAKAGDAVATDSPLTLEPVRCLGKGLRCGVSCQTLTDVQAMTTSQARVYQRSLLSGILRTADGSAMDAESRACALDRLRMVFIRRKMHNA